MSPPVIVQTVWIRLCSMIWYILWINRPKVFHILCYRSQVKPCEWYYAWRIIIYVYNNLSFLWRNVSTAERPGKTIQTFRQLSFGNVWWVFDWNMQIVGFPAFEKMFDWFVIGLCSIVWWNWGECFKHVYLFAERHKCFHKTIFFYQ